ncbi:hypothetical protein GALMADRAFT_280164 [Galerina marginata CBS 339.88]|uniref:DUF6534 domain-containing protein n=1 Tax=Galerina marginata (strain CBS 339.88) TaxID=685588 RepID=A0A067T6Y6_GALM3|nr:hypothetical protein GALMADRAFT_280164 [Galerina marginata CBS 339.88]
MDLATTQFDVHGTLGALLVGLLISCCLFGIVSVQAYMYYTQFPNDRTPLKIMVMAVWFCELVHCICICQSFYFFTVSRYGNPEALSKLPMTFDVAILLSAIIATIVQFFFIQRVRDLSGKPYIPMLCWTASSIRFVLTIVGASNAFKMITLSQYEAEWDWLYITVLVVDALVDLTIAMSLTYYLKKQRVNAQKSTSYLIDRLTGWTIQTGLVTSLAAMCIPICYLAMRTNFIWLAIFLIWARVLSNSLLASLNGRTSLRERNYFELQMRTGRFSSTRLPPWPQVAVHVTQTTEVKFDPVFEHGII